jgi:hypothetical protein
MRLRILVGALSLGAWTGTAAAQTPDRIFADEFATGDLSGWSSANTDLGDLTVTTGAALGGADFGLLATVDDQAGLFVQDDTPEAEDRYRARFYFDPSGFDPGEAGGRLRVRLFIGFADAPVQRLVTLVLRRREGQFAVMGRVRRNDGGTADTPFVPVTDEAHLIELDWRRSAPGASDGGFDLRIDNVLVASLYGIENDLRALDFARMGALTVKPGASGTMRWARFDSRRVSLIGPAPGPVFEPGLLIVADTSGSMNGALPTASSCADQPQTRAGHMTCAIRNLVAGEGDLMVGLARWRTTCTGTGNCTTQGPSCTGTGAGDIIAPVAEDSPLTAAWVDGVGTGCSSTCATPELIAVSAVAGTQIGGALESARSYYQSGSGSFPSPIAVDRAHVPPRDQCRRYAVVVIADGDEDCGGNAAAAAAALRNTQVGGEAHDVLTYAIAFAGASIASMDLIAQAGGTVSAYAAVNESGLGLALADIADDLRGRSGCPCVFRGPETCNGQDDDCNGLVDDALTAPPPSYCLTTGACAPSGPEVPRVCDSDLGRWVCQYGPDVETDGIGNVVPETRCDGRDNDCDGAVDVARSGTDACAACVASAEVCDGVDNDCDGAVDEPKGSPGPNPSYVIEPLVQVLPTSYVSAYEASRPDATEASAGFLESRACARAGVLPWAHVTSVDAAAACQAAGLRLCTEVEWQRACAISAGTPCTWGKLTSCRTYVPTACNGNDLDGIPGGADDDVLLQTGALAMCAANWPVTGIFDLSGNLDEWASRAPGVHALRGGSYHDSADGIRCQFSALASGSDWEAAHAGFRCCSSTAP